MATRRHRFRFPRELMAQWAALGCLLLMAGFALVGPSGLLAWGESQRLLEQRTARIAALEEEREELRVKVAALDPDATDPDMVGELLREHLHVLHPDEVVLDLSERR